MEAHVLLYEAPTSVWLTMASLRLLLSRYVWRDIVQYKELHSESVSHIMKTQTDQKRKYTLLHKKYLLSRNTLPSCDNVAAECAMECSGHAKHKHQHVFVRFTREWHLGTEDETTEHWWKILFCSGHHYY